MKNQYVGDIGDYGKYALLRALSANYSIGINWYLTTSDNKPDGRFIDYLLKPNDCLDSELFNKLKSLLFSNTNEVKLDNRNVLQIEKNDFIPKAKFYNDELEFSSKINRLLHRIDWVSRSFEKLLPSDIIFFDPDNGLEVKSVSSTSKNGNKYVTYDEAVRYYNHAKVAVVIYNHRDRSKDEDYCKRFLRFYKLEGTKDSFVYRLSFHKSSVRDYIFVVKPEFCITIHDFIMDFARKNKMYFTFSGLPMPLAKRWALDDAPVAYTREEYEKKQKEYKERLRKNYNKKS